MSEGSRAGRILELRDLLLRVVFDDSGRERSIESRSQLAHEIAGSTHVVSRQFLSQLPNHCNMLAAAVADGLDALSRLDPSLAFSGVTIARGLLEASADLYWLSDRDLDRVERTRRTFLVFLRQHETQVRDLCYCLKRLPPDREGEIPKLEEAVTQGRESLKQCAEEMASVGYELRTSKKPGSKYSVGEPKPPTSDLVDRLISACLGVTAIPVYGLYSSVAHAEGEGLGSLRVIGNMAETAEGTRYLRGFDDPMWQERVLIPTSRGAAGALKAWAELAYPKRWEMSRPFV